MSKKTSLLALAGAALLGAASISHAQPFFLNFDGLGSTANDFAPINLTIGFGELIQDTNEDGDPIDGSFHWAIPNPNDFVLVNNPNDVGYGLAPSGTQALDARFGPVLFVFENPWDISEFSFTLDNSGFGDLFDTKVEFYDENNTLLYSQSFDQTVPGLQVNINSPSLVGVKTIVLPSNAYYDNVQAVPEPSTWALLAGGAAFLLYRLRRRSIRLS